MFVARNKGEALKREATGVRQRRTGAAALFEGGPAALGCAPEPMATMEGGGHGPRVASIESRLLGPRSRAPRFEDPPYRVHRRPYMRRRRLGQDPRYL